MTTQQRVAAAVILAIILIILLVTFWTPQAKAGEDRGVWFKSLKMPGSNASCCDISDCKATEAAFREGQWWAVVAGEWTPIPPEKELLDKTSIDGDAYVCASAARQIYCFVKPDFGT